MGNIWRLRRARHATGRRAALARVPERPNTQARIQPLLAEARTVGVLVEELDGQHLRLLYDARVREHWLVIDAIYDAIHDYAAIEGEGQTEASPANWMVIHFDYAACETSFPPQ